MRTAIFHDLPSGGAKRALFEIARRLAIEHVIDVYSLSTADHEFCDLRPVTRRNYTYKFQPLRLLRSPFGRLNQLQRWRDLQRLDQLADQIAADVDHRNYDVVYAHPSKWTQTPLVLKYLKTPSIYHVHEPLREAYEPAMSRPYLNEGFRSRIDKIDPLIPLYRKKLVELDRSNTRRATRLLANSHFTAANVSRIYGRIAEVAYFGVDSTLFRPLNDVEEEGFVLSIGALQANKGFDFLIKVLGIIPPSARQTLWIICNSEDLRERSYLENLAREEAVNLVIETMVDNETLVQRYNQAALLAYAPVREPFGLVTLEAMACGIPVVGVAEGGFQEAIVEGVTGFLTPRDPDVFAKRVNDLLSNPIQRKKMGHAGRDSVISNWTWEVAVQRIEARLADTARRSNSL